MTNTINHFKCLKSAIIKLLQFPCPDPSRVGRSGKTSFRVLTLKDKLLRPPRHSGQQNRYSHI